MKSFYYNVDDAEFVDRTGEKLSRFVPELFYQERAEWRIFLRDGGNTVVDISDVVAWGAAVDCDYRGETSPMCRTLSGDIAADAEAGSITVKLDAATAEFFAAVDGMQKRKAFFALYGLNRDGERRLQLEFEISARMIIDPDPVVPLQVPDTLATRAYVSARIDSAADLAYAAACEGMSGAMASGGYVTSSGARIVAAAAASSATSGAVFSGAEIDTIVGDYRLTYTSSGGLMVSGGGVQLQVSSGGIVASADNGDYGANIGTVLSMTSNGGVTVSAYNVAAGGGKEYSATITADGITASGVRGESVVMAGGTITALASGYDEGEGAPFMSFSLTSDALIASGASGESVVMSGGGIAVGAGTVAVGISGDNIEISGARGDVTIGGFANINAEGNVSLNSRPVLTQLVTSTDTTTTSASFAELAGGTAYIYTQPLTALTVASVEADCDATIKFTAGAGLSGIGLPSSCYFTGESAFTSGSHYFAAFNGADVVVIEQKKLDEV